MYNRCFDAVPPFADRLDTPPMARLADTPILRGSDLSSVWDFHLGGPGRRGDPTPPLAAALPIAARTAGTAWVRRALGA